MADSGFKPRYKAGDPLPKGPNGQMAPLPEIAAWAAYQPIDVQRKTQADIFKMFPGDDYRRQYTKSVQHEQGQAFTQGVRLPGVNATGEGTGLSPKQIANSLTAGNIDRSTGLEGDVSTNPADYSYKPTLDPGAGGSAADKYKYLGNADPLANIDQTRTDTTGVDAQKRMLAQDEALLGQGGLSAIDRARIASSTQIREAQARGTSEAAMRDAEEQGRGGGNLAYLNRMKGAQAATQGRAMDDLQTSALGLQRMDTIRGQAAGIGNDIQTAQDVIDHFNTQGRRDVRDAQWVEKNRRQSVDAAEHNRGVDSDIGYSRFLSAQNTDRTNDAGRFNVNPTQGARGMLRDKEGVAEIANGASAQGAALLTAQGTATDQARQAQEDALLKSGTSLLTGTITAATGKPG